MATWQVDFYIIPRRALVSHGAMESSDLDRTPWWKIHTLPTDYQKRLGAVASAEPSQRADIQTWGPQDGNRIDVWSEDGRVRSVMARVDVRKLDSRFGAALLHFVRAAGAVLVRRDGLVVEPQIGSYTAALRTSDAWKFASDPAAFFAKYSDADDT